MKIVPATQAHAQQLGRNLRPEDKVEIADAIGMTPRLGVVHSLDASVTAYAALQGPRVVGMWGCAPSPKRSDTGCPWLLCSPLVEQYRRELITETPKFIQEAHQMFPRLENYVRADNWLARRWLVWAGFQMVEHVHHYGVSRTPFIRFVKEAP